MNFRAHLFVMGCATSLLLSTGVDAQQPDTLRQRFLVPPPPAQQTLSAALRSAPGITVGSPVAFGADWGDFYAGAVAVNRQRYYPAHRGRRNLDGAVVVGFGLGDAREYLGVDVAVASYSTLRRGFFNRMGASVKVHRQLPANFAVAVGMENALTRGPVDDDRSVYGAVSRVWVGESWNPTRGISTTVGVGNGRFRSEADWRADRNSVGGFANAAIFIADPVSLIADYNQDLSLGLSLIPVRGVPLSITASVLDVTGRAGDGRRFSVGVGTGLSLR
jgi:hypothetical protein